MITGFGRSLELFEIGYVFEDGQVVIRHAMPARDKFIPHPKRRTKRR